MFENDENPKMTVRLREIASKYAEDPASMPPEYRKMFGEVKKKLILSMLETAVAIGIRKALN